MALSAEQVLLLLQKQQAEHDERAHRDILLLDTQTRVKHMVLHFLKYLGKISVAHRNKNQTALEAVLLDTLIICLATANALNVSLGEHWGEGSDLDSIAKRFGKELASTDLFEEAIFSLADIGGQMAKAVESTDHWEKGDPRAAMETLIVEFSKRVLALIGKTSIPKVDAAIKARWAGIEKKHIFYRLQQFQ